MILFYSIYTHHNSFKCSVIGSISSENAGPTAITVFDPDFICVCPASSTMYVFIPFYNFYNFYFIYNIYYKPLLFTTIFAPPEFSQLWSLNLDKSSYFATYSIWRYAPMTACPTWAQIFPFPIFNDPLVIKSIFALLTFGFVTTFYSVLILV